VNHHPAKPTLAVMLCFCFSVKAALDERDANELDAALLRCWLIDLPRVRCG
jgi:hypothetical protein